MNATLRLPATQEELDQRIIELLRLTYQASVMAVCLTYLAGQQVIAAGVATRQWVHWLDESKIMAAPCWEWPIRFINYVVEYCSEHPSENSQDLTETPQNLTETPQDLDIEFEAKDLLEAKSNDHLGGMTIRELKAIARDLKIPSYGRMTKAALIGALSNV